MGHVSFIQPDSPGPRFNHSQFAFLARTMMIANRRKPTCQRTPACIAGRSEPTDAKQGLLVQAMQIPGNRV